MRQVHSLLQVTIIATATATAKANQEVRGEAQWRSMQNESIASPAMTNHFRACPTLFMTAENKNGIRVKAKTVHFAHKSFELLINNCASRSITNDVNDFKSPSMPARTQIQGIKGNSDATLLGTVKLSIEDDEGNALDLILPHTYYSPTAKKKLLSPQH
jgi:hypothetical protein